MSKGGSYNVTPKSFGQMSEIFSTNANSFGIGVHSTRIIPADQEFLYGEISNHPQVVRAFLRPQHRLERLKIGVIVRRLSRPNFDKTKDFRELP